MEPLKHILKGQKEFMMDLLAPINFILLAFAYFAGVGLSRIFIKRERINDAKSFWRDSELTKKEKESYLRQF